MTRRIHTRIAQSRNTAFTATLYGTVVWAAAGLFTERWWWQFVVFIVSAPLLATLCNIHAMTRVAGGMVQLMFVMLTAMLTSAFADLTDAIAVMLFIVAYTSLFDGYQAPQSPMTSYCAALFIGAASLLNVHMLVYILPVWVVMAAYLQSMSIRSFAASLLGVTTPYWFTGAYCFVFDDLAHAAERHFAPITQLTLPPDYSAMTASALLPGALTAVLAVTAFVHLFCTSYEDKTRVRMLYYSFMLTAVCAAAFLVLFPEQHALHTRILIVCTAPLAAHLFAFSTARATAAAFIITIALILAITLYNLWTSSPLF